MEENHLEETKKCCANCKNNFCGVCDILKEQNPEYKELSESNKLTLAEGPGSAWLRMIEIENTYICSFYKSLYIEYPLVVDKIETEEIKYNKPLGHEKGCLVAVRPCSEEYKNKTYLGILLGDLPRYINNSFNNKTRILKSSAVQNPGIWVPELKEIIFGDSSWWHEIKNENELKEITNDVIENQWYIKLLKGEKQ